jgi:hypothetical protein
VSLIDADFANQVRLSVLATARRTSHVPDAAQVARDLGRPAADVVEAFRQLAEGHVYVLEPGDPSRLRMAHPFSAVPTPFRVEAGGGRYFGNCVWDALGVVSMLGGEGRVLTSCPDCQEPLVLEVSQRRLARGDGVVHFSVPARRWWDDIVHT